MSQNEQRYRTTVLITEFVILCAFLYWKRCKNVVATHLDQALAELDRYSCGDSNGIRTAVSTTTTLESRFCFYFLELNMGCGQYCFFTPSIIFLILSL